jgi:hypothetical protein
MPVTKFPPLSKEEKNDPEEVFAWTFHSFKDLHDISPIQFLARLERRGVVLALKPKKSRGCANV